MPFDTTTMNRSCTKSIPSWKDKYSVICYTSTQLCVPEHLKCPEEQLAVKYSLTPTDCQLSQKTGVSDRSLSAFVQLFSTPGAWSPLGLNFVSMDTKMRVNK